MQAAHHATGRAGETVLREGSGIYSSRAHHIGIEGAAEEAALVYMGFRMKKQGAGNARNQNDLHGASLSARYFPS
jgi:hypothetical protein